MAGLQYALTVLDRHPGIRPSPAGAVCGYDQIEAELRSFEETERRRLGLDARPERHWHDANPQQFTRAQRATTTILLGGLTIAQDTLIQAALGALGYRIEVLDCPDVAALQLGKEFGNRGQCNPTYFTVGNLLKRLTYLRDVERQPVKEIIANYVFLTAGACGPCRFGTYVTEYRKVLRDAGFDGFRVLLFQQMGGLKQATGIDSGLEFNTRFFIQIIKALIAGDLLNLMGYRLRPYELEPGATDAALDRSKTLLCEAFQRRRSIFRALRRCRRELDTIAIDRLQAKPKVMIIGEFWAMTTEGDGNYRLQRFLEAEGAEVDIQPVTAWLLYMLWQVRHDTRRRMLLRGTDAGRRGLAGQRPHWTLARIWAGERILRWLFRRYARAIGLSHYALPDMDELAREAGPYYSTELRGGEGHMEVGKLIQAVTEHKAHMVISVKPFGCMPSSAVSDGVQAAVVSRYPQALFCPVETTGDGAVNFQSRILMTLFKARRRARAEFADALVAGHTTRDAARAARTRRQRRGTFYPPHVVAGTAANVVLGDGR
jgi:predicted nucleotide-binding protein (sugar kinase/HSP70/actin superfamily)